MIMKLLTLLSVMVCSEAFLSSVSKSQLSSRAAARSMLTVTMSPDTGANLNSSDDDGDDVDFLLSDSELAGEPATAFDDTPPAPFLHAKALSEMQAKYRRSESDTGSPEFQVASMTERILYLTKHLQANPKDFSTRRGLVALVNKRRRLLNYLFSEDVDRYSSLVSSLGIRHKAPGRVMSREEKYAKFKSKKK
mmetsp:Transcript_11510/g.20978  ORF Transcript_11510/g.20978 Transcript_11510/m.20978 type:complete len:193 (+) Transcript_11510:33-611(+)